MKVTKVKKEIEKVIDKPIDIGYQTVRQIKPKIKPKKASASSSLAHDNHASRQIKTKVKPKKGSSSAAPVNDDYISDDKRYFNCPTCGLVVQIGDDTCPHCGTAFNENGEAISSQTADKLRFAFRKKKAAIITAAVILIGGTGVSTGVDLATQITVPDVQGKAAVEALTTLEDAGFDSEDIYFYCDEMMTADEIKTGEYEVTSQSVEEGNKIHSDDTITLDCKDLYKERTEAIEAVRYENVEEAIGTAEQYDYAYSLANIGKDKDFEGSYNSLSTAEKSGYYVYDIASLDHDKREAVLTVDSKENIESEVDRLFEKCVDEHVADAEKIADALDIELECLDYDNKTTSVSSALVVTGVKGFDFNNKQITLNTDTEQHLEDLKILPTLADKIPYKGLNARYLSDTAVGKYDRIEDDSDDYDLDEGEKAYYWISDDGKYDVLKVVCKSDKVTKVKKLNKNVYWTAELPDFSADKDAYDAQVAAAAAAKEAQEKANEQMVWVSGSGSCYHSNPNCSNMRNPWEVPLSQAENMGRRACKKCY